MQLFHLDSCRAHVESSCKCISPPALFITHWALLQIISRSNYSWQCQCVGSANKQYNDSRSEVVSPWVWLQNVFAVSMIKICQNVSSSDFKFRIEEPGESPELAKCHCFLVLICCRLLFSDLRDSWYLMSTKYAFFDLEEQATANIFLRIKNHFLLP